MRSMESKLKEGQFDLAVLRAFKASGDEAAALERLRGDGWDLKAYLIDPSPARLLIKHDALIYTLQTAGKILLAASNPVSMQAVEHVFRLCA